MSNLQNVEVMKKAQQDNKNLLKRGLVGVGAVAAAVPAFAADEWSAQLVQIITGAIATVSSIGLAVLTLYVTAKVFKWVKTAM